MKYIVLFVMIMTVLAVGCVQKDPLAGYCKDNEKPVVVCEPIVQGQEDNLNGTETSNTIVVIGDTSTTTTTTEKPKPQIDYAATLTYEEGEFVDLSNTKTEDPDSDKISLTFGEPLDNDGKWQTKIGDIGTYTVNVVASDGKLNTTNNIMIVITKKNMPPNLILESSKITVTEGSNVTIKANATDPEGEDVIISYSGWMTSPEYATTYDDAGEYVVTVTAKDSKNVVSKDVRVIVKNKNRAPVIEQPTYDVIAVEGDLIEIKLNAYDPDKDEIKIKYDKPFDKSGKWQTEKGDAGKYMIKVTASDNDDSSSVEVPVTVEKLNHAPVLEPIGAIEVNEGDTIIFNVNATDIDGDKLTLTYSGWMNSSTYKTSYEDAGDHIVAISAFDGIETVTQEVSVKVNDVNRPPVFVWK